MKVVDYLKKRTPPDKRRIALLLCLVLFRIPAVLSIIYRCGISLSQGLRDRQKGQEGVGFTDQLTRFAAYEYG